MGTLLPSPAVSSTKSSERSRRDLSSGRSSSGIKASGVQHDASRCPAPCPVICPIEISIMPRNGLVSLQPISKFGQFYVRFLGRCYLVPAPVLPQPAARAREVIIALCKVQRPLTRIVRPVGASRTPVRICGRRQYIVSPPGRDGHRASGSRGNHPAWAACL